MDLFEYMAEQKKDAEAPLASRLRPRTLDEVVGQQHLVGKGKMLYRMIQADRLSSVIFYGPPGTGKTTLARVIANTTSAEFCQINATSAGKKDMEDVVNAAKQRLGGYGKRTILFIDEIHRFNKGQQDYLLPFVEDGTITLIGATTENPYFEVNQALLSRSMIFELKPLEREDIEVLLGRAIHDTERGLGAYHAVIDDDALSFLADMAGGDARHALNAIEMAVLTTERSADGKIHITMDVARECIQKRVSHYDKSGDGHYDTISAFIKSMRGSDPDAAVYYLARMIRAGEDPVFIARRIMICACEDVGNADPQAEYVATAPKSNTAAESVFAAEKEVDRSGDLPIPPYLQDAHYSHAKDLGHGIGYEYAHDYREHYAGQQYLPDAIRDISLYQPSENGYEKMIRAHMSHLTGQAKYTEKEQLKERDGDSRTQQ